VVTPYAHYNRLATAELLSMKAHLALDPSP
jgi:hypothetical protein